MTCKNCFSGAPGGAPGQTIEFSTRRRIPQVFDSESDTDRLLSVTSSHVYMLLSVPSGNRYRAWRATVATSARGYLRDASLRHPRDAVASERDSPRVFVPARPYRRLAWRMAAINGILPSRVGALPAWCERGEFAARTVRTDVRPGGVCIEQTFELRVG